jgi:cell wall-associated NlpC family hydrolase
VAASFVALLAPGAQATPALATATVRVPVANVWAKPDVGHLPLDPRVWPTTAVTYEQRLALVDRLVTQVLYGERVLVLGRRGGWTKIAVPDQPSPLDRRGYPGWIRSWQLGPPLQRGPGEVTVTVPTATLANGTEVSFGTRLPLERRLGRMVQVSTPQGVSRLPASAVRSLPRTRADLVRTAKLFLGLHYLWGGLSAWGFDCSGFTWAVYRAHGITIPRDADAQFAAGKAVAMDALEPDDLIFYGVRHVHHVAMYMGEGMMIESRNSASMVEIAPVRSEDLAGARRFLP